MKQKDLTHGSILGNIITFSMPYMLSYLLQILYGLADLFVIGQYDNVASITSVSNGAQVMYMFTVVIIGLAMGTTVNIARAVGANDPERISRTIGNTAIVFILLSLLLSVTLLFFKYGIVHLLGTPVAAVEGTLDYLTICFFGHSIYRGL